MVARRDQDEDRQLVRADAGAVIQRRALSVSKDAITAVSAAALLQSTGPTAELSAAFQRGVLDEARRTLIAKKGSGVVFEAGTVVAAQELNERCALNLTASLSSMPNDPRTDVLITMRGDCIDLQLKTGSDNYIRAQLRRRQPDGVVYLIPKDAHHLTGDGVKTSLEFDGIELDMPTRDELLEQTRHSLDRLESGAPVLESKDVAAMALRGALIDGIVVGVVDLSLQALQQPTQPIDWRRAGLAVVRGSAVSAISSFLAGSHAVSAGIFLARQLDATHVLRRARVAGCIIPHAVDAAIDALAASKGTISTEQLLSRVAGHTGAAVAELVAFKYIARLAARCGPLGIIVVMIGGAIAATAGRKLGETAYAILFGAPTQAMQRAVPERPVQSGPSIWDAILSVAGTLRTELEVEADRRKTLASEHRCEERNCEGKHHARGMCGKHYKRWWRGRRRLAAWHFGTVAPQ